MSRPEHSRAPEDYYDETEAAKYAGSGRMHTVQREIARRALELLSLEPGMPHVVLDVGCGSGLSGEVIADEGHAWIGFDISPAMLDIARRSLIERRQVEEDVDDDQADEDGSDDEMEPDRPSDEGDDVDDLSESKPAWHGCGDVVQLDMGHGLGVRPNSVDGCISVSAVQWLCYSHRAGEVPHRRLRAFFASLYACLRRGARAAIQLYPESPEQMEMITNAAMAAGFTGGVVIDYPNSAKAKKFYLVLFAGAADKRTPELPRARAGRSRDDEREDEPTVRVEGRGAQHRHSGKRAHGRSDRPAKKSRQWIQAKKETQRRQGKEVRPDSKYSGRKRSGKFF